MKENIEEIRSKLWDLYNRFAKARGEWNDGYKQGVMDSLSIVSEVNRASHKTDENDHFVDIEKFKNNYFKKGFGK